MFFLFLPTGVLRISALSYPNPTAAHRGGNAAPYLVARKAPEPLVAPKPSGINGIGCRMRLQPVGFDC